MDWSSAVVALGDLAFPAFRAWYLSRKVAGTPPDVDGWLGVLAAASSSQETASAAADLFENQTARLDRLEAKLRGHGPQLAIVTPLAIGAAGLAVNAQNWVAAGLAVLAIFHVLAAGLAVSAGGSAMPRYLVTTEDIRDAVANGESVKDRVAAVQLACIEGNGPRGIVLNNWTHVAQVSIVWAGILSGIAALIAVRGALAAS